MRGPTGFPDRIRVKLNYYAIEQATLTSGSAAYVQYNGNNVYACRYSGGHQPYAFDQWKLFYGRYRVLGSSIRVTPMLGGTNFTGSSSTNAIGILVVPAPTDVTPGVEVLEQPYARYRCGSVYSSDHTVKHYMSTAKIWGVSKKSVHDEDDFTGAIGGNPTNGWWWYIYFFSPSGTTDTYYMSANLKLTYYVEFYKRYTEGQS